MRRSTASRPIKSTPPRRGRGGTGGNPSGPPLSAGPTEGGRRVPSSWRANGAASDIRTTAPPSSWKGGPLRQLLSRPAVGPSWDTVPTSSRDKVWVARTWSWPRPSAPTGKPSATRSCNMSSRLTTIWNRPLSPAQGWRTALAGRSWRRRALEGHAERGRKLPRMTTFYVNVPGRVCADR